MSTQLLPTVDIGDDFIGVIHNACPLELCDQLKEYFDIYNAKDGFTYTRQSTEMSSTLDKEDVSLSITGMNLVQEVNIRQVGYLFCGSFWQHCYAPYADKFTILGKMSQHKVIDMKLQRTLPGQGYHIWHAEACTRELSNRILAFIVYLNDVEEGGETEFLYQRRRVKPTKGTCVLWPASFTHVHRGNPPLSNEKYVLTGWVEF